MCNYQLLRLGINNFKYFQQLKIQFSNQTRSLPLQGLSVANPNVVKQIGVIWRFLRNVISFVWAGRIRTKLSSHWEYHSATRRRIGCKAVGYKKKCGTGMVHLRTDRLTGNNKYSSFSFSFFWGSIVFSQMFIPSHVNAYTCKTWWQTLNHTSTPHDTVWIMCIQWIATIRRVFPEIFLTEFLCWFFDPSDVLSLNDPRCCYII